MNAPTHPGARVGRTIRVFNEEGKTLELHVQGPFLLRPGRSKATTSIMHPRTYLQIGEHKPAPVLTAITFDSSTTRSRSAWLPDRLTRARLENACAARYPVAHRSCEPRLNYRINFHDLRGAVGGTAHAGIPRPPYKTNR